MRADRDRSGETAKPSQAGRDARAMHGEEVKERQGEVEAGVAAKVKLQEQYLKHM